MAKLYNERATDKGSKIGNMGKIRVRLSDIAVQTGFSKNTVSLALRDSSRIPQSTREIIKKTAQEMQYFPNHVAQSLTSQQTKTIGLVIADLGNPILTQASRAIATSLKDLGYGTLFATSNNDVDEEQAVIEGFRSRQVDGMLVYPVRSQRSFEYIRNLRQQGFPVILLTTGQGNTGVDFVNVDEKLGAYKAVKHLIDIGHTKIGIIDGNQADSNLSKFDGYSQALADAGIKFCKEWQADPIEHTPAGGFRAMKKLMSVAKPTAVFVANDYIAMGVMNWCSGNNLKIPKDIAIIGFDNLEMSNFMQVPLSSVNYELEVVTRVAIERLLEQIHAGSNLPEPRSSLIEPDLVIRESTVI